MEYNRLGHSGLQVSSLCLGTLMFGSLTPDDEAAEILAVARDAGVNFVDTADTYSDGQSEVVLGKLLGARRADWIVSSKVGNPSGNSRLERGLSRKRVRHQVEGSLSRLRTDFIDILHLHLPDPETELEETLATVAALMREGKVLYWGFTNYRGWQVAELVRVGDSVGLPRPATCQAYYNLVNRLAETELLPACHHFGIGVTAFSPLARGVLTAKYAEDAPAPADSRAGRGDSRMLEAEFRPESLHVAQLMARHAVSRGMTPIDFALRWLLNNRAVASVLGGPRTLAQWKSYLSYLQHKFDSDDEALVDSWVRPGQMATPGAIDPKFPPAGRSQLRVTP